MSLHYLLDGYNIIPQMPLSTLKKLEDQRQQLIRWIESCRPQGSSRNTVTVVFDGRVGVWGGGAVPSSVQVVFSQEESADEKIIRMVEEAKHKKNVVVVTDDRSLKYAVRAQGAKVSGVQTFLGKVKTSAGSAAPACQPETGKHISQTLEHKITSEMAKIWLKDEKGMKP